MYYKAFLPNCQHYFHISAHYRYKKAENISPFSVPFPFPYCFPFVSAFLLCFCCTFAMLLRCVCAVLRCQFVILPLYFSAPHIAAQAQNNKPPALLLEKGHYYRRALSPPYRYILPPNSLPQLERSHPPA